MKPATANVGFPDRILRLRRQRSLSQSEVADLVTKRLKSLGVPKGVSNTTVSHWERAFSRPRGDHLIALAFVYRCSAEWMLTGWEP